jgi:hypothetical protein
MKRTIAALIASTTLLSGISFADSRVTTIESKVEVVPSTTNGITTYRVYGPEKVIYKIQAPDPQLQQLSALIKENPDAVVRFDGQVVDEAGVKVFKVNDWERTQTTTTTTTTDALGNKAIRKETHTETKHSNH